MQEEFDSKALSIVVFGRSYAMEFALPKSESFGIKVGHEAIKQDEDLVNIVGGVCLLRGEYVLIINSKATTVDTIKTLAAALKHFDLDQICLRPVFRELLHKIPD